MRSGTPGYVQPALAIRANGVGFVVVSAQTNSRFQFIVFVCNPVFVGINHFGELGHLAYDQVTGFHDMHSAAIVKTRGKPFPTKPLRILRGLGGHDVAAPQRYIKHSVGVEVEGSDFGRHVFGKLE